MSYATWLNNLTLPEFSDLTKKQFIFTNETVKPVASVMYNYVDLTSHNEPSKRFDELDVETFASTKLEGENAAKARAGVGYNKTLTAKRVAKEIDLSWEFGRYGNEHAAKSKLHALNGFINNRKDLDLTHNFTFATSSSFTDMDGFTITTTTGDGNVLAYATHELSHSTSTYRNRVSGDPAFSQSALELAETLFKTDIVTNFGEKRVSIPNTIFTTDLPALTNDVKRVLESTADVDAAHAGVTNVYSKKYKHVVLPFLDSDANGNNDSTKKRWWGIANIGINGLQAYYGVFEAPNMKTPHEDPHNDDKTFGVRGSHGSVIVGPKGLAMSCPTSVK